MRSKRLFSLLVQASLICYLAIFSFDATAASPPSEIKVGAVFPLTGPVSSIGIAKQRGTLYGC